jgi:hypothetical protein
VLKCGVTIFGVEGRPRSQQKTLPRRAKPMTRSIAATRVGVREVGGGTTEAPVPT